MKDDIIRKIEASLNINDSLPKIDPNTQQPVNNQSVSIYDAAVPAMLAGLYKKTRSEEGASELANYAGVSEADATTEMQNIADVSREYVVNDLKHDNATSLMNFFTAQRTHILTHLPAELHMGELINDTTIDDKTNKMEGPMSGLMHGIEKIFSSSK